MLRLLIRCQAGANHRGTMKALIFDGRTRLERQYPDPAREPGWSTIHVACAGVCRTDLEITRGYMKYEGVLGHELVGSVTASDDPDLVGQRVVGEINTTCGQCDWCIVGLGRHCPGRSVLGIHNLDGCMAERCVLPDRNLFAVPGALSDEEAVFIEPLSAAFEILEQISLNGSERCVVLGDGKLGILCAWALSTALADVTLIGHHQHKIERARWGALAATTDAGSVPVGADLVIEATGSVGGLHQAMELVRPRGTLVLKSTISASKNLNLAPAVIKELNIVGSRCGPFERGIRELVDHSFPVQRLIDARFPLDDGANALARAAEPGVLKVVINVG